MPRAIILPLKKVLTYTILLVTGQVALHTTTHALSKLVGLNLSPRSSPLLVGFSALSFSNTSLPENDTLANSITNLLYKHAPTVCLGISVFASILVGESVRVSVTGFQAGKKSWLRDPWDICQPANRTRIKNNAVTCALKWARRWSMIMLPATLTIAFICGMPHLWKKACASPVEFDKTDLTRGIVSALGVVLSSSVVYLFLEPRPKIRLAAY